jgi:hypothetical protein
MHSYRSIHSAVHAVIASVCWFVLQHYDQLQALAYGYPKLASAAIIASLVLLFRASDGIARLLIEQVPLLSRGLRRLLSGRQWIEGDWPLVVVDMVKQQPLYLGFLRIDFRGGQPYVHGDDWHMDGEHAHAFESVQSLQTEEMLQYWYRQGASLHEADMRGYTEIFFFPHGALAERHAGKFLDPKHTDDIRFYAVRRRYRWREKRIASKQEKLEAASGLWQQLAPRLAALRDRKISADFG